MTEKFAHQEEAAIKPSPFFRPMPVLTALSLLCLGLLVLLGYWQWEKFVSKSKPSEGVSALSSTNIATALEAPNPEYRPVAVTGLADPRTIKISVVQEGFRGYRLFSPITLESGAIFVDRGFVNEDDLPRIAALNGPVQINGVLRKGARANAYTPDNDAAANVWYWPDLPTMAYTLSLNSVEGRFYIAQITVDPLGTGQSKMNPYADSKGANQIPRERHLGYALTWWGFGLALIGVYIGLHVRNGRLQFRRAPSP